jgi:hypothetical protein
VRVLVSTTAGAGHFGPLIPFAYALRDSGHDVAVMAPNALSPAIVRAGLPHRPCADIPAEAIGRVFGEMRKMSFQESNLHYVQEVFGRLGLRSRLADVNRTVADWQPDLILRETLEIASFVVAETLDLPQAQVATGLASLDELIAPVLAEPLVEVGVSEGEARLRSIPRLSHVPASFEVASSLPGSTWRFRWNPRRVPGFGCELPRITAIWRPSRHQAVPNSRRRTFEARRRTTHCPETKVRRAMALDARASGADLCGIPA